MLNCIERNILSGRINLNFVSFQHAPLTLPTALLVLLKPNALLVNQDFMEIPVSILVPSAVVVICAIKGRDTVYLCHVMQGTTAVSATCNAPSPVPALLVIFTQGFVTTVETGFMETNVVCNAHKTANPAREIPVAQRVMRVIMAGFVKIIVHIVGEMDAVTMMMVCVKKESVSQIFMAKNATKHVRKVAVRMGHAMQMATAYGDALLDSPVYPVARIVL